MQYQAYETQAILNSRINSLRFFCNQNKLFVNKKEKELVLVLRLGLNLSEV